MAHNSLFPAFVKIRYTSPYGEHIMTVPSVPIDATAHPSGFSFDLRGAAINVDLQISVEDYVDLLAPFFHATVTFVDFVAYSMADPEAVPTPLYAGALGIVGTNPDTDWDKAVQRTWTFRADDFTLFKIVMLDAASNNNFDKVTVLAGAADSLRDYVVDPVTWIASRGGGRPQTFLQFATTLNEALRRAYGMN